MLGLAKQFRRPIGILGRLAGTYMSLDNRKINRWTLERLQIKPGDYLLEIGFGPGAAIKDIFKKYRKVRIDGIDISKDMKEAAASRNKPYIRSKKLRLFTGDVLSIEKDGLYAYDKVFSVNNYPLWPDKRGALKRLHDLMKPGGTIAITVQPREEDASRQKTFSHAQDIEQGLFYAGFRDISVKFKSIPPELTVCVTALKQREGK